MSYEAASQKRVWLAEDIKRIFYRNHAWGVKLCMEISKNIKKLISETKKIYPNSTEENILTILMEYSDEELRNLISMPQESTKEDQGNEIANEPCQDIPYENIV